MHLVGIIVDLHLVGLTVIELISRHCLRLISQFDRVRRVESLCLGGGYVVFPLRLARIFDNEEINEDTGLILDLYVADEDEIPDIPLSDRIPIDPEAKKPSLSPKSPPYGSMELYVPSKNERMKGNCKRKIPSGRQGNEASKVAKEHSTKNGCYISDFKSEKENSG